MFDLSRIGGIGRDRWPRPIALAAVLLTVAIFLLDLALPRGAAAGVPYVSVVLLTLWLPNRRGRIIAVATTSLLTVAGFFHPPPPAIGPEFWLSLQNRVLTLVTLWATGILGDLLVRRTEQLDAARNQLVQSERLAAIGQTLAVLSHEGNNELNTLKLGLEVLTRTDDREAIGHSLDAMRTSLDRLTRLFEDIRSFASPIVVETAPIAVADVWRRAWEQVAPSRAGRNAELSEVVGPPGSAGPQHLICLADPFRLEQVFRNLFENSLAACRDPVRISVHASAGRDGTVTVRVRDNGPGIAADLRERIFEPFFTTKSKGTGLGMSISRRILEAHGGTLELATNKPGTAGAEFVLHLRAAQSGS
jgi:C4-dicarboxylate-specific signal transduction histidine kinase